MKVSSGMVGWLLDNACLLERVRDGREKTSIDELGSYVYFQTSQSIGGLGGMITELRELAESLKEFEEYD